MKQKNEGAYYTKNEIREILQELNDSRLELGNGYQIMESRFDAVSFLTRAEDLIRNASQRV